MQKTRILNIVATALLLFWTGSILAGDWDITPRLTVGTIYSDNIGLDSENEDSDLVIEVTPSISVHGEGGRLRADIDYSMQNSVFVENSDANGVFHQLNADGTAELVKDLFFFDAASTMGQSIIDASETASTGNLSTAGNRTDFFTYSLSPYLQPRFGSYADGLLRYTYSEVRYDEGASDSKINEIDANLTSGRNFGPLFWSANYNYLEQTQSASADTKFETTSAQARYRINRYFSLVGTAGSTNNEFQSNTNVVNGSYWSAGAFLQPSRYYSLEAQQGNNLKSATVSLYPTSRTSLVTNYRDQEVGTNPGEVWSGSFNHYTRRTTWNASYTEDTTTRQQAILEQGGIAILGIDPVTGLVRDPPEPGDLIVTVPLPPLVSLTDEVIERTRASGTFGMKAGKTGMRITVFREESLFLESLDEEDTKGVSGSVNRRMAPRTNGILTFSYQRIGNSDDDSEDTLKYVQAEVTRRMSSRMNASVSYRFTTRDSEESDRDYSENRIAARLTATF